MSEEDFLSRWSRRKREADEAAPAEQPDAAVSRTPEATAPSKADEVPQEEFDLSTLPSIDSITAVTDVTAFLRKGVPLELTRAALRRAWTADPAIRDFVGLAENAWDFNDPNAMPGFGPLDQSPDQVRELVARIMGEVRRTAEAVTAPSGEPPPSSVVPPNSRPTLANQEQPSTVVPSDPEVATEATDQAPPSPAAEANPISADVASHKQPRSLKTARGHGGALPR